jgi:alpha-tubulin suppressor-like RCC1 family protein
VHLLPADRITAIASGGNHCMALTVGGSLWGFGRNKHGALGCGDEEDKWKPTKMELAAPGEEGRCIRAVQVVCGGSHTLALTSKHGCRQALCDEPLLLRDSPARPAAFED